MAPTVMVRRFGCRRTPEEVEPARTGSLATVSSRRQVSRGIGPALRGAPVPCVTVDQSQGWGSLAAPQRRAQPTASC